MENRNALLRALPKIDELLRLFAAQAADIPEAMIKKAAQEQIGRFREAILTGQRDSLEQGEILQAIRDQLTRDGRLHLRRVINATGVVLHTNLGRAKLSAQTMEHVCAVATSYSNLEYELDSGERGSRYDHVVELLRQITGAESALVTNNNAAAVLLALDTLTKDTEVIISRGELVEIGGSFRVPAIMQRSGCRMIEVGTTNKTHPADYINAITDQTGALLKVHTSNYKIVGFTEEVCLPALWEIGSSRKLPVIYDLGSGLFADLTPYGIHGEPPVRECVPYADVICFSGDKLLGGPQAGIIVGKQAAIDRMKKNHLLRALRIDKLTLSALEHTLWQYLRMDDVTSTIPTLQMLTESHIAIREKLTMLTSLLQVRPEITLEAMDVQSQVGGGSLPDVVLPSVALGLTSPTRTADQLERLLRSNDPPIIARVAKERVLLDLRTVDYSELPLVAACINTL